MIEVMWSTTTGYLTYNFAGGRVPSHMYREDANFGTMSSICGWSQDSSNTCKLDEFNDKVRAHGTGGGEVEAD